MDASQIREHMEVLGSDGGHVGVVDGIEGERIKLVRKDATAQGLHHYIPLDRVASVKDGAVHLTGTAAEVMAEWTSEARGTKPGSSFAGP
jgi:hypothetical protein